jgi:hypothetical protein
MGGGLRYRNPASDGSTNRALMDALRRAWTERKYYPPVTAVVPGQDGSIWVRREDAGADSVAWQVFDRNGKEVGRLSTPPSLTILWASKQEVWAVENGELDVPFVVGMRVNVSGDAHPN